MWDRECVRVVVVVVGSLASYRVGTLPPSLPTQVLQDMQATIKTDLVQLLEGVMSKPGAGAGLSSGLAACGCPRVLHATAEALGGCGRGGGGGRGGRVGELLRSVHAYPYGLWPVACTFQTPDPLLLPSPQSTPPGLYCKT